jgi:exodeoxyribonuclease-3
VKILCLNIRSGGGSRWGAILQFVDEHDPDIAVFTEWRRSTSSAETILRAAFGDWTMLACYFPQGEAKRRYFDVCCDVARACSGHPLLVLGDLNTGNQLADRTPGGVNYACADRFDRLSSSAGLIDFWRLTNGPHAREWTWRTSKNGFRIDHAFGNGEFVQRYRPAGHYDHAPREARFSDHSALLVSMIETHSL